MAESGIPIVENLIRMTGSVVIQEICGIWGYKSELDDFNKTVSLIKNMLLDAVSKRELSDNVRACIDDLLAAVYDADDLFDEFCTLAELKQLDITKDEDVFLKVRNLFSNVAEGASQAHRISRQVKDIEEQLDCIVSKHHNFSFSFDYKPIIRKEDTNSYVDEEDIIGRENDKKIVMDMLLGSNSAYHKDFCFVTIMGVGGLGKTALAKLVYNDDNVIKEFQDPELRLWVCVSDQDGAQFDVNAILCKILELVTGEKPCGESSLERLQKQFQALLKGKKYLLVLDDVWNEDLEEWLKLRNILLLGRRGSRVVVTTRSERTAEIIGDNTYKLQGLSPENSWHLFETTALVKGKEYIDYHELAKVGKSIVKKCDNIPLAIKVVGNLLFGQEIRMWSIFEEWESNEIGSSKGDDKIMSIIKLSYYNLESSLQSCFRYCAILPKDTRIEKEVLISLWVAQGYILPFHEDQSIEDAAEEHFFILLRRCFFQDVERDKYGDVMFVRIQNLMHDVAEAVGGEEIGVLGSITTNLGDKFRHVHYVGDERLGSFVFNGKIRSLMFRCKGVIGSVITRLGDEVHLMQYVGHERLGSSVFSGKIRSKMLRYKGGPVDTRIEDSWMRLRVLHLENSRWDILPYWIGKLLHLRYLNLSGSCDLWKLDDSITELHNLETLILHNCSKLWNLPGDFSKLVKLRHLDLRGCRRMTSLPSGLYKLNGLKVLPLFIIDRELKVLNPLSNIRGKIYIKFEEEEVITDGERGYLKSTKHLTELRIAFGSGLFVEDLMRKLEPHRNLKGFVLEQYNGKTIPRWGRAEDNWAISFPNLAKIELSYCSNLKHLPSLSELPFLKSLQLISLHSLEYIESKSSNTSGDEGEEFTIFFPSLESLKIKDLISLKGWWKEDVFRRRIGFPRLSHLEINSCNSLKSFPACPSLEILVLLNVMHENVGIFKDGSKRLRRLVIDSAHHLTSIVSNDQSNLSEDQKEDDSIPWKSLNESLRSLIFKSMKGSDMPTAVNGMLYLTSLDELEFWNCEEMEALPEWIGNLSSLTTLSIKYCHVLKSLPESIRNLTSLQKLKIIYSIYIERRCRKHNGEDWPNIQHIPDVVFG